MITANLYPDRYEVKMGETTDEYSAWRTSGFNTTYDGATVEDVESYFLGYISSDNMPYSYGMTAIYYDEDGKLIFKNITENNNYPCGYAHNSADSDSQRIIYYERNGNRTWGNNVSQVTLFNQNYPMYSGRSNRSSFALSFTFNYVIYDGGGNLFITTEEPGIATYTFQTVGEALRFFRGETEIDVSLTTYSGTPLRVKLNTENFAEGNAYLPIEGTSYSVRIFIVDFQSTTGAEARNGGLYSTMLPQFMVKTTAEFNGESFTLVSSGCDSTASYTINYIESQSPTEDEPLILYGNAFSGEFVETQLDNLYLSLVVFGDNMVVERHNWGLSTSIVHSLDEIQHGFYLAYRGDTTVNSYTIGYVENVTYATDVSSSNEFLARWKTGNLEDASFRNRLRDWQYEDNGFQEEDFEEEDVPDINPGPDGDWDPDTVPGEDDNDYEINPTTQLHQPFLGAIGQTWWAMAPLEWSGIVRNVKQILTTWNEYVTFALPINQKNIHAEFEKNKYSSGFVSNPVDCVASVMWYPFDITLLLDATPADFVWGGTTQVIMSGVGEDGAPETTTTEQSLITGYLNNAYWLDGGFTNYFKHYDNFIDYQPYCTAELYVPYCGSVKIDPQQYVGHHLSVRYLVDFPTGACLALIYRDNLVVDSIAGQIGVTIAMSMPDYIEYGGRHMQAATNVKASKFQQLGTIWGMLGKGASGDIASIFTGSTAVSAGFETIKNAEYQLDNTLINQKTISTATPAISTGNEQKCRLVLYQPRWLSGYKNKQYGNYGHTTGFATVRNERLGNFTGLTIADSVDTSGISQATEKEKAMIQKAFKTGVYI